MVGSTVVIIPQAGNMAHYLRSLQRMLDLELNHLAPGHGDLIDAPDEEIRDLIAHRLKREQKVVDALRSVGPCPIATLLPIVYDDRSRSLYQDGGEVAVRVLVEAPRRRSCRYRGAGWGLG